MQRVTCLIDVKAPCQEVFETVANLERRMQLSPLWGLNRLLEFSPNFPEPGSSYRVRVLTDKPFGLAQGTLNTKQSALFGLSQALFLRLGHTDPENTPQIESGGGGQTVEGIEQKHPKETSVEQQYFIEEYQPPYKLSYYLNEDCETIITWSFQSIPFGTRINYEEVFCDENVRDENFITTVQHVIREWLSNIKRYSELRDGRGRKAVKWFLDHFYLKLRPDQRRVVLVMLYLQAIGLGTFLIAVIGWGIASLFV
jgi:hypothetical protein